MIEKKVWPKIPLAPILNFFSSMRNPRWVGNNLPKNYYLILTLTHSKISFKVENPLSLFKIGQTRDKGKRKMWEWDKEVSVKEKKEKGKVKKYF